MSVPDAPAITVTSGHKNIVVSWSDVDSATSYNLYYNNSKCPNCLFNNFNNWRLYKRITATAVISSGKALITIPNADDAITIFYKYLLPDNDYVVTIDFTDYSSTDNDEGLQVGFAIRDMPANNNIYVYYRTDNGSPMHLVSTAYKVNGSSYTITEGDRISARPTKLRLERDGTNIKTYYFATGWVLLDIIDYTDYVANLTIVAPNIFDNNLKGGYAEFDNLIITPTAESSGTKLEGVTSPYTLTFDTGTISAIQVTAENAEGEGSASVEDFGVIGWHSYWLGPDLYNTINNGHLVRNMIQFFPDYSYRDGEKEEKTLIRAKTGKLFDYKYYDYKQISFDTNYVTASDTSHVNSWWSTQTKLIFHKEIGDTISSVNSVVLINEESPFSELSPGYHDVYKGKIILQEYV